MTSAKRSVRRCGTALACGLAIATLMPDGAQAQLINNSAPGAGNIATGRGSHTPANLAEKAAPPSPDAIPGARSRGPVAPASRPIADMAPNEALFDAINRGDIATARDALNRGAELNATNILGMTPLELSVDLGRNDISFLLLSMRGEDAGRGSRAVAGNAKPDGKGAVAVKAAPKVAAKAPPPVRPTAIAATPVVAPKLFANDGGTPQPQAGFLGFDARSATN